MHVTTKYSIAKENLAALRTSAQDASMDEADVLEALLVTAIQDFKALKGSDYARGMLQYEVDSLGSGSVYDLPRGGGHS